MKTLNELIAEYSKSLKQGDLQAAYKGILDYLGRLRSDFELRYTDCETGSNIYQGYMDMSYFSLTTKQLKEKGLKIAVVYVHRKGAFEIWLSARNREILKKYKNIIIDPQWKGMPVFHDADNGDAVIEYTLSSEPDFDKQNLLTEEIEKGTERFLSVITKIL
jgi:hypothetical protein